MGTYIEEQASSAIQSPPKVTEFISLIQRHLRKDRMQNLYTHLKQIQREFRGAREDMVSPTMISIEALHMLARKRQLLGVVYIEKDSELDRAKTDIIPIRTDRTALVIQVTGGPTNTSKHRQDIRSYFGISDLQEIPLLVTKTRTQSGRMITPLEYCQLYGYHILHKPGIALPPQRFRNIAWK
jgi:hypothetical protein